VLALIIYAGCLGINWSWQVAFLYRILSAGPSALHAASICVYLALISLVVRDDCVLVRWLWINAGRAWANVAEQISSPKKKKKQQQRPMEQGGSPSPSPSKKQE
jgi:hypothetical protein